MFLLSRVRSFFFSFLWTPVPSLRSIWICSNGISAREGSSSSNSMAGKNSERKGMRGGGRQERREAMSGGQQLGNFGSCFREVEIDRD